MLPEAFVAHSAAGRLRVKIRSKKGDRAYFDSLKEKFSTVPGVHRIEVNPSTASVLVLHSFDLNTLDVKTIAEYTELSGLFKLVLPGPEAQSASGTITKTYLEANQKVTSFTQGALDIPTLTSLGLLGTGIFQLSRGNLIAPAWHVAFWYALNIFLQNRSGNNVKANGSGNLRVGQ